MSRPKIFISYSHKDEVWKDRLVTHLGVLGSVELWDDRRIEAGAGWLEEIESAMGSADAAILLVSADALTSSFILDREVETLLTRRQRDGLLVVPLLVRPCAWQAVPWLASIQMRPADGQALSTFDEAGIDQHLADLALELRDLLSARPVVDTPPGTVNPTSVVGQRIAPSRLPRTTGQLFGREGELAELDAMWADGGTNVLTVVAWG
ncbi:MAG: toll/interleukin-1 receptor domain-containing protein, partial [Acidobacteriota bacterium]